MLVSQTLSLIYAWLVILYCYLTVSFDSVDRLYYSVTRITTHYYTLENLVDPKPEKIATGFFYQNLSNGQRFLITNKHVIVNENENYFPNVVRIKFHVNPKDLKQNRDYDIPLYQSAKKLWLQPKEGSADIVAIKIDITELVQRHFIATFFASNNLLPTDMRLHVADDVFVMGYPLGIYDEIHNLPITRNGTISSAYPVYFNEKPYFLVDANLQEGASGSPVITKFKYIRPVASGGSIFSGPSCYLLGIISSTFPFGETRKPPELNATYYASIIESMTA